MSHQITTQPTPATDNYVLITPCRNEATFARRCIESVIAQTVRPELWLIVDDGSTDETASIVSEYATTHKWIRLISRPDRGKRAVGPGVIDAFYSGLDVVNLDQFQYLCKFDLDLDIPPRYFQILLERMKEEPRLGTCSGKAYYHAPGSLDLTSEGCGDETSVGMTKFYRTTCFKEIGGFIREVMWDGIDCHTCRMMGWIARSWDEPDLRFIHLRPMGSSQVSLWHGRMRHGRGQFFMGTGITYMTASCIYRIFRRPFLVGGVGMMVGYLKSMCTRTTRYQNEAFSAHLKQYQWSCLLRGKHRTMKQYHDQIRHA